MPYRTLGELRAEIQARLGMASMGAGGQNQTLIDSMLRNGQKQLYLVGAWKRLHRYEDFTLGVNQYLISYPTAADPDRLLTLAVNIGSTDSPNWETLKEGISPQHYNTQHLTSWPTRYQCYEQIELWPKNDISRTLRMFYIKALDRFTQDGDRATLDDEMVMLHALTNAKLHYRQPDAETYANQLESIIVGLKNISWPKMNFSRGPDYETPPKPVVV